MSLLLESNKRRMLPSCLAFPSQQMFLYLYSTNLDLKSIYFILFQGILQFLEVLLFLHSQNTTDANSCPFHPHLSVLLWKTHLRITAQSCVDVARQWRSEALMAAAVQRLVPESSVPAQAPCSSWINSPKLLARAGLWTNPCPCSILQLQLWPWLEVCCSQLLCVQKNQKKRDAEKHKLPDCHVLQSGSTCHGVQWNVLDSQLSSLKSYDLFLLI